MVTAERADQESTRSNIGKSNSNNSNGDRQYRHWQSQYGQLRLQLQLQLQQPRSNNQERAQLNRVDDVYVIENTYDRSYVGNFFTLPRNKPIDPEAPMIVNIDLFEY
ncbi:hypothetical protein V1478_008480 [Vespula squamosa]|uniref:Uncharacterized protein n=1 Tax=Vespula squamosa TaxID=30214 RepID=A0ABD2AUG5_VESSQ